MTPTFRPTIGNPLSRASASISSSDGFVVAGVERRGVRLDARVDDVHGLTVTNRLDAIERVARARAPTPASRSSPSTTPPICRARVRPGRDLGEPGGFPFTRGIYPDDVPRRGCGRCASTRAWRPPTRPTSGSAYLLEHGQTGLRSRSTCRPRWAWTPTIRGPRERWARRASRSTPFDDMRRLFDGIPLDRVSTSMTINATAPDPAAALRAGGRGAGRRRRPRSAARSRTTS